MGTPAKGLVCYTFSRVQTVRMGLRSVCAKFGAGGGREAGGKGAKNRGDKKSGAKKRGCLQRPVIEKN